MLYMHFIVYAKRLYISILILLQQLLSGKCIFDSYPPANPEVLSARKSAPAPMTRILPCGESTCCIEEESHGSSPINCEDREGSRLLSSVLPRSLVYRNQSAARLELIRSTA